MTRTAKHIVAALSVAALGLVVGGMALAGAPEPWQIGMQEAASPVKERLHFFHDQLMMPIITAISVFVLALLVYVCIRYSKKNNPVPSTVTHNIPLEIVWTLVPAAIVIGIMFPSVGLMFYMDRTEKPELTLQVTGYQWYWGYEYPDYSVGDSKFEFKANMIPDKDIDPAKDQKRLLSTDNAVVLPVDTDIKILVTAADVLHAFAVPAFGVKKDAVPGRNNETWVRITKPGVYFGQCSELCGTGHAFMPIEIHAVTRQEFDAWVSAKKVEFDIPEKPVATDDQVSLLTP